MSQTGDQPRRNRFARITPPRLQTVEEGRHRTATWLELFYDLAFVVVVAVLGSRLQADVSWPGLTSFIGYFALLWWLWASHTFYADRYDTDDLVYRLLATAQERGVRVETLSTDAPTEVARYASLMLSGTYASEYLRLGLVED